MMWPNPGIVPRVSPRPRSAGQPAIAHHHDQARAVLGHHAAGDNPGRLIQDDRVFRMVHHFGLAGWAEATIAIRFWLIAGLFAALGRGLFSLEWRPGQPGH
jgi:hypothetical protein